MVFTGFRRRHDQAALATANRCRQIQYARRQVFGRTIAALHPQTGIGVQRRQVLEQDLAAGVFRLVVVDFVDFQQGKIALAFFWRANLTGNGVTCAEVEAADLARGYVDVVGTGEVGTVSRAEETESILQYLEHAVAEDIFSAFRMLLQNGEDNVLLAHAGKVFQPHIFAESNQLRNRRIL